MSELAPYERLHSLAERALEHAGRGELDEIAEIAAERAQIVASLPPSPPAAARALLERTLALQERTTIDLRRGREQLLRELSAVHQGQRAADGYGASAATKRVRHEQLA